MQLLNKYVNFSTLYYYIICLLIFFIPLNMTVCSYLIAVLCVVWIAEGNFRAKFKNIISSGITLLFISYFLIYLIGLAYSSNINFGLFDLGIKLSILIFPLIFSSFNKDFYLKSDIAVYFKTYILGCFLASAICLSYAIYQYYQLHDTDVFYYKTISIIYHPSYFSMFLNLAVAILIYFLIEKESNKFTASKLKYLFLLLLFSVMIVLLSSKAGILSLALILVLSVAYLIIYKKKYIIGAATLCITIPLLIALLEIFPYSIRRAEESKKAIVSKAYDNANSEDGTSNRIQIWKSSVSLIKEYPLFGVGTGDVKDKLMERYRQNQLMSSYERKLNAHNQFLQTTVATGLVGFLILFLGLVLPMFLALRDRQMIYLVFLLLIIINICVEAMFEVQGGVVFYGFFNSLLFYSYNKRRSPDIISDKAL